MVAYCALIPMVNPDRINGHIKLIIMLNLPENSSLKHKKAHFRIENGLLNLLPLLGSNQRPSD